MKIRHCCACNLEMNVPLNSCKKWCTSCYRERQRIYEKEYYQEHKEGRAGKYRDKAEAWRKANPVKEILTRVRRRAKMSGIPFNLTEDDIVIPTHCPVLKVLLVRNTEYAPSIDKIQPHLGYVSGNVQFISMKANVMKNSATKEELKLFADWINNEFLVKVVDVPRVMEVN